MVNILSLFDGISAGKLALARSNIKVNNYFASEIDKYAIQISNKNYPDIIQLGDINLLNEDKLKSLPKIDLLIGGPSCQSFSSGGKKLNFEDPRGKLLYEYVRILNWLKLNNNPDIKFLLENVKMKSEWSNIISDSLGVQYIELNSSMVSAQERRRLYWTNIDIKNELLNKNINLDSILEEVVDDKYYLSPNRNDYNYDKSKLNKLVYKNTPMNLGRSKNWGIVIRNTNKAYTLRASNPNGIIDSNYKIRRFTPLECERLQTFPDNYTAVVSDTQRYKALGNSWTVDIISYIFSNLKLN